jgi:hypothetical protein
LVVISQSLARLPAGEAGLLGDRWLAAGDGTTVELAGLSGGKRAAGRLGIFRHALCIAGDERPFTASGFMIVHSGAWSAIAKGSM